jgi:hypothetical protein
MHLEDLPTCLLNTIRKFLDVQHSTLQLNKCLNTKSCESQAIRIYKQQIADFFGQQHSFGDMSIDDVFVLLRLPFDQLFLHRSTKDIEIRASLRCQKKLLKGSSDSQFREWFLQNLTPKTRCLPIATLKSKLSKRHQDMDITEWYTHVFLPQDFFLVKIFTPISLSIYYCQKMFEENKTNKVLSYYLRTSSLFRHEVMLRSYNFDIPICYLNDILLNILSNQVSPYSSISIMKFLQHQTKQKPITVQESIKKMSQTFWITRKKTLADPSHEKKLAECLTKKPLLFIGFVPDEWFPKRIHVNVNENGMDFVYNAKENMERLRLKGKSFIIDYPLISQPIYISHWVDAFVNEVINVEDLRKMYLYDNYDPILRKWDWERCVDVGLISMEIKSESFKNFITAQKCALEHYIDRRKYNFLREGFYLIEQHGK